MLFESFLGKQYAGNPRYIYEALRHMRPDLRCVWAYNGSQSIPGDPQRVERGSAEYFRLLAQARYRVNNVLFEAAGRKPETIYLQTWHGNPLKRLGRDIELDGPETEARGKLHQESRGWSMMLSANRYSSTIFRRAFDFDGPMIESGYPLVDPMLDPTLDRDHLAQRLGLPSGRRFVLYAPTWRDHRPVGTWRFDFDLSLDLQAISAALAPDQVLLVKAHHLVGAGLDPEAFPANVMDVSHLGDISELCALAEVLITDYSSVFFDFAVTGRPINETTVVAPGINGKMNEVCAAFGLLQLKHIDRALERRAQIDALYRRLLAGIPGLRCLRAPAGVEGNHAYFPVMVGDEFPLQRDELYQRMRDQQVLVRRYFYPLISEFPMYRGLPSAAAGNLPVASAAARRVLCLPIHPDLGDADVERICALVAAPARVRAA